MKKSNGKAPVRKPVDSDDHSGSEDDYRGKPTQQKKVVDDSESDAERYEDRSDAENSGSEDKNSDKGGKADAGDKLEIFIKSLSYDVDEDELNKIFGKYGTMTKCKLI